LSQAPASAKGSGVAGQPGLRIPQCANPAQLFTVSQLFTPDPINRNPLTGKEFWKIVEETV
jgi:hypothetical protein